MLGIIVGLVAEARLARGLGGAVAIGGGGAAGAAVAAARLVADGAQALVSFGLAGGLAPETVAGAIIVPTAILSEDGLRWEVDFGLARRLGDPCGVMLAPRGIIVTPAAKHLAWQASGAVAADLESGAVAQVAAVHGLPFAVLRAVCDPAGRDLPHAAMTALNSQGAIQPWALIRSLARHPGQIGGLVALGREAALARAALLARVAAIGRLD